MKNKVTFNDLTDKCKMRIVGLITEEELKTWFFDNFKVKSYLRMLDKNSVLSTLNGYFALLDIGKVNPIDYSCNIEMRYLFVLLFRYTDVVIPYDKQNVDVYDYIVESGLSDMILEVCGNDYKRLKEMANSIINFNDMYNFRDVIRNLDYTKLENDISNIEQFFSHKEEMDTLKTIIEYNDPAMKTLKETFAKQNFTQEKIPE